MVGVESGESEAECKAAARRFLVVSSHGLSQSWQWRDFYAAMLAAPHEEIEVESTLMKHRGGSPNNPYLQPTPMTYAHTIVPATLAERVMSAGSTTSTTFSRSSGTTLQILALVERYCPSSVLVPCPAARSVGCVSPAPCTANLIYLYLTVSYHFIEL